MVDVNNTIDPSIAVLVPCLNEASSIRRVVEDFRKVLPQASIFVFDNGSDDGTVEEAKKLNVPIYHVKLKGKGNVVRSMFRHINADVYVMIDGDGTYFAEDVNSLVEPILCGSVDMVVGDRISSLAYDRENTRRFHGFGNRLIRWLVNKQYKADCKDVLSGYRAFNHFFVSNFPVMSSGFEIETEITLHALDKKLEFTEVPIQYSERQAGSSSKLKTISDGLRILKTIFFVFKNYKPLLFFSALALFISMLGIIVGTFPIIEYIKYDYVYKLPLAVLAASLELMALLFLICGLMLDTSVRQHKEQLELRMMDYYRRNKEKCE